MSVRKDEVDKVLWAFAPGCYIGHGLNSLSYEECARFIRVARADLEQRLKEAEEVIGDYSDPQSDFWVDRVAVNEKTGEKIYHMKNIVQLSKRARDYLAKHSGGKE